jgi:hypothetical protein
MKASLLFLLTIFLLFGCGSPSENLPGNLAEEWYSISKESSEWVLVEKNWGFDRILLRKEGEVIKEIEVSEAGGVEVYNVIETNISSDGINFSLEGNLSISFSWMDREKNIGKWITPYITIIAVSKDSRDNYKLIAYSGEVTLEENDYSQGVSEFIFTDVYLDFNYGNVMINFQEKNGDRILSFSSSEMGLDFNNNEFFSSKTEAGGAIPMLINNNESIFQPYSFKYHLEKKRKCPDR